MTPKEAEAWCDGWIVGLIAATALKLGQARWDDFTKEYVDKKALALPEVQGEAE